MEQESSCFGRVSWGKSDQNLNCQSTKTFMPCLTLAVYRQLGDGFQSLVIPFATFRQADTSDVVCRTFGREFQRRSERVCVMYMID